MTTVFVGITTNTSISPINAHLPNAKRLVLPMKQTLHTGGDSRATFQTKTAMAMSFWPGSGLLFLKDSHKEAFILSRHRSGASVSILPYSSSATPLGPKLKMEYNRIC